MGLKVNREVIGGLLRERRETEKEEKLLQEEIDRLCSMRDKITEENPTQNVEILVSLDQKIEKLKQEQMEQIQKRKNLCKTARFISAGD